MRYIRALLLTGGLTYVGLLYLFAKTMEKNHMAATKVRPRVVNLGIVVGWDPSRPDPKGVKVTERNYDEVAKWVGGNTKALHKELGYGDLTDHRVKIFTDRGNRVRVARVGDVVVKYDTDKFGVVKEKDFLGFEK